MPKFKLVLSTLLLSAVVSSVPTQASQSTEALSNLSGSGLTPLNEFRLPSLSPYSSPLRGENERGGETRVQSPPKLGDLGGFKRQVRNFYGSSKGMVQTSLDKDNTPPVDPQGTVSRGPCTIAPLDLKTNTEVWSDRPLFVWQGPLGQIEVREQGSNNVLWRQPLEPGIARIQYAGEPLQSGQVYDWVLFDLENNVTSVIAFKVMDAQAREQVNIQLQNLERELKSKRATAEESAILRAQLFAGQRLWSDAWREAFSVGDPMKVIGTIPQTPPTPFCMRRPNPIPSKPVDSEEN